MCIYVESTHQPDCAMHGVAADVCQPGGRGLQGRRGGGGSGNLFRITPLAYCGAENSEQLLSITAKQLQDVVEIKCLIICYFSHLSEGMFFLLNVLLMNVNYTCYCFRRILK